MSTDPKASPSGYGRVALYDPVNKRISFLDPVDGGILPVIDSKESMINREVFFTAVIKEEKLKPNKKKYLYLKTPSGKTEIHFTGRVSVTEPIFVNFYENPTIDDEGTPVETFNNDRNSTKVAAFKVFENPDFSDMGEYHRAAYIKDYGEPTKKLILKRNTKYLIEIEAQVKNTTAIIELTWYEADR